MKHWPKNKKTYPIHRAAPTFDQQSTKAEVLETASLLMMIAAVFQISDGIQAIGAGALRGLSDAKFPAVVTLIAYWGIGLPGAYYLGFVANLGMAGIWYES